MSSPWIAWNSQASYKIWNRSVLLRSYRKCKPRHITIIEGSCHKWFKHLNWGVVWIPEGVLQTKNARNKSRDWYQNLWPSMRPKRHWGMKDKRRRMETEPQGSVPLQQASRRRSSERIEDGHMTDTRGRYVEGPRASRKHSASLSFQGEDPELVLESIPGSFPTAAFIYPGHIFWDPPWLDTLYA